jgi:hypothetical protein
MGRSRGVGAPGRGGRSRATVSPVKASRGYSLGLAFRSTGVTFFMVNQNFSADQTARSSNSIWTPPVSTDSPSSPILPEVSEASVVDPRNTSFT